MKDYQTLITDRGRPNLMMSFWGTVTFVRHSYIYIYIYYMTICCSWIDVVGLEMLNSGFSTEERLGGKAAKATTFKMDQNG